RKFGQTEELSNQKKSVTEIASIVTEERTIICLITKEYYWQKPSYENVFLALTNLKHYCISENITRLAMPKIACGLDELQWPEVRTMMRYIFRNTQVQKLIFTDNKYSKEEKLKIIEEFHNTPMGGHQGIARTIKRIK
ncbi:O-acetyl-ADP-ribose deacetylase 1-like, partial [Sipha flava]|uniref:O-acetyl-ADP-ribose deacetylase 1-like n=1 Tax=Sipha flava TaxID=143950 RepID=A0A8B8GE63_9HEMI